MHTTRCPTPPQPSQPFIVAIDLLVFAATGAGGCPFRYCRGDHDLVARSLSDRRNSVGCLTSWKSLLMIVTTG
jgi:hypothetical protein